MLKSRFNLKTFSDSREDVVEEEKVEPKPKPPPRPTKQNEEGEAEEEETAVDESSPHETTATAVENLETQISQIISIVRKLHKSEISKRLSMIGKIADGDGYSYLKATCTGMRLTQLTSLLCFKHLQFVNVSTNLLTTEALEPVMELPFLILLQADANLVTSEKLKRGKYLQVLMLNHNHITTVYEVYHPQLATLEVGFNKIQVVNFKNRMSELKALNLRDNQIADISNFSFSNLGSLYIAGNRIKSLVGLDKMPNLKVLHVRNNPIKNLDGFSAALTKLQYVNLRNCKVSKLFQIRKLQVLPGLEVLIIKGCPLMGGTGGEVPKKDEVEEDPALRIEVIATLIRLKRLNKINVTPDERTEAKELMKNLLEEGEEDQEELEDELEETDQTENFEEQD